jgi:hypothetical protein
MQNYEPADDFDRSSLESDLNTACLAGYWNICQWILKKYPQHINIYYWSGTFFTQVCARAPLEFIDWFISTYPDYNVAIGTGYANPYNCLTSCAKFGRFSLFEKLMQVYKIDITKLDVNHLLCCVSSTGDIEFADYLLLNGADITINNNEPLRMAESAKQTKFVNYFNGK